MGALPSWQRRAVKTRARRPRTPAAVTLTAPGLASPEDNAQARYAAPDADRAQRDRRPDRRTGLRVPDLRQRSFASNASNVTGLRRHGQQGWRSRRRQRHDELHRRAGSAAHDPLLLALARRAGNVDGALVSRPPVSSPSSWDSIARRALRPADSRRDRRRTRWLDGFRARQGHSAQFEHELRQVSPAADGARTASSRWRSKACGPMAPATRPKSSACRKARTTTSPTVTEWTSSIAAPTGSRPTRFSSACSTAMTRAASTSPTPPSASVRCFYSNPSTAYYWKFTWGRENGEVRTVLKEGGITGTTTLYNEAVSIAERPVYAKSALCLPRRPDRPQRL